MRVRVNKRFPYSLDGNDVAEAQPGDVVSDEVDPRLPRWALELGEGEELDVEAGAPETAARGKAPKKAAR